MPYIIAKKYITQPGPRPECTVWWL